MANGSSSAEARSFDDLKERVQAVIQRHELEKALDLLERWIGAPREYPGPSSRAWLFQAYGQCAEESGQAEKGLNTLAPLYAMEPRDREVCLAFGQLLLASGKEEEASRVWQSLLVHHQCDLEPELVGTLYTRLGDRCVEQKDLAAAVVAYDQALSADPSNRTAMAGMLEVTDEAQDDSLPYHALQLLAKRLDDDVAMAAVLQRQGDYLYHRKNDHEGALRCYQDALERVPGSLLALRSEAELLRELGQIGQAVDVYLELASSPSGVSASQKEGYLDQAWECLESMDSGGMRQAKVIERILDASPGRIKLFEVLTGTLRELEAWDELEEAYQRMIDRLGRGGPGGDERVLPLLYYNLGELRALQLDKRSEAADAFLEAANLLPQDAELRRRILQLLSERGDRLEDGIRIGRELLELIPNDPEVKIRLAEFLLQAGRTDEAVCLLKVAHAETPFNGDLEQSYKRLVHAKFRLPARPLEEALVRQYVRPAEQETVLNSACAIGSVVFQRVFANDLSTFGVKERDRLNPAEDILFNRIYRGLGELLAVRSLPKVYLKRDLTGMTNAALDSPAFFVGPDMMSGRSERELAFIIAQQLILIRPEFVLSTLQEAKHLRTLFLVMIQKVDPSFGSQIQGDVKPLVKQLDKRMTPELFAHLKELVDTIIQQEATIDLTVWVRTVADLANRVGLLFCDDQETADRCMLVNPGPKGLSDLGERQQSLHRWACSEAFFALRREMGMNVKGVIPA